MLFVKIDEFFAESRELDLERELVFDFAIDGFGEIDFTMEGLGDNDFDFAIDGLADRGFSITGHGDLDSSCKPDNEDIDISVVYSTCNLFSGVVGLLGGIIALVSDFSIESLFFGVE